MHNIKFKNDHNEFFKTNTQLKNFLFSIRENNLEFDFEVFIDTKLTKTLNDYLSIVKLINPKIEIPDTISTVEEIIEFFDIISFYKKINELSC